MKGTGNFSGRMMSMVYLRKVIAEKKLANKDELSLKTSVWRKTLLTTINTKKKQVLPSYWDIYCSFQFLKLDIDFVRLNVYPLVRSLEKWFRELSLIFPSSREFNNFGTITSIFEDHLSNGCIHVNVN